MSFPRASTPNQGQDARGLQNLTQSDSLYKTLNKRQQATLHQDIKKLNTQLNLMIKQVNVQQHVNNTIRLQNKQSPSKHFQIIPPDFKDVMANHQILHIDHKTQDEVDHIMQQLPSHKIMAETKSRLESLKQIPVPINTPITEYKFKLYTEQAIKGDNEKNNKQNTYDIRRELIQRPELQSSQEMLKYQNHLVSKAHQVFHNVQKLKNHNKWNHET